MYGFSTCIYNRFILACVKICSFLFYANLCVCVSVYQIIQMITLMPLSVYVYSLITNQQGAILICYSVVCTGFPGNNKIDMYVSVLVHL